MHYYYYTDPQREHDVDHEVEPPAGAEYEEYGDYDPEPDCGPACGVCGAGVEVVQPDGTVWPEYKIATVPVCRACWVKHWGARADELEEMAAELGDDARR